MLEKLGKAATKLEQAAALIREAISNASPSVPDRFGERKRRGRRMANDTERNYRCVICGEKTPWMFRQKSICDACDTRIDKLVAIHAGPHASSHELANFKEKMLDLCIEFAESRDIDGLSYSQTLHSLKEKGGDFGDISKGMGRHMFFKEFRRGIDRTAIEKCIEFMDTNSGMVVFREYQKTTKEP